MANADLIISQRPSVEELLKHPFVRSAGRTEELQALFSEVAPGSGQDQGTNSEPSSVVRRVRRCDAACI